MDLERVCSQTGQPYNELKYTLLYQDIFLMTDFAPQVMCYLILLKPCF
jgi:hypothetical protein